MQVLEPSLGPLQEKQVPVTSEPSLQPQVCYFFIVISYFKWWFLMCGFAAEKENIVSSLSLGSVSSITLSHELYSTVRKAPGLSRAEYAL